MTFVAIILGSLVSLGGALVSVIVMAVRDKPHRAVD